MAKGVTRKHLEALQAYNERLNLINKQLENLNKNSKEYKKLQAEKNKVIQKGAKAQRELAAATGKLSSTLPNNKKLIDESAKAQKNWNNSTSAGANVSKGFFGRLKTAIGTLTRYSIAYKAINLGQQLFNELLVNSAKRAIALEKALADVAAVANLTSAEMDRLEKVVFNVAGSTSLTAIEVVELQKQLAKLGTSVEDIENLTRPVALLSQALGEDPGGVAASLKKTLNQFQATSEEADRFANTLVGAINESALSLNDLGTALQYVGPLAAQSGLSFEETAAFIGVLADNGFRASRAGTGLRNVILEASKDGREFSDVLEDLAQRNLTVAEATELFGKRGAAAAIVLAKNIERIEELNEELQDNTRLLSANAKQMSSTQGQIDLLSSAYNRASIRLGDYITQTEFFIELIELLDPSVAGQARAYKFLATATEEGSKSFDELTTSLVGYKTTQEEVDAGLQAQFKILKESQGFTDEQIKLVKAQFVLEKMKNKEITLSGFLQQKSNDQMKDAGLFLGGLIELSSERARSIREENIALDAKNDNYKEAEALTNRLTQSAKEGLMTDKEQERVTKGLADKLTQLQQAREDSSSVEEIIVLEKRIALFEELKTKVENLENSQEAISKREKKRIDDDKKLREQQLKDAIKRIKEQEKIIKEELSKDISDEQFLTQVELLNSIFGEADKIISEAERLYGKDSEFVQGLKDVFAGAAQEVSVGLPEAAKNTMDITTSAILSTIDFIKNNRDLFSFEDVIIEGIERTADAIDDFAEVRQENFENEQRARLDSLKRNGSIEEDILRAQLDNQLITESQFRAKKLELQRAQIAKENGINKQIFDSQQKQDRIDAATDFAVALASIIPNMLKRGEAGEPVTTALKAKISAGLAAASFAAEIAAINSRKFVPKQFEQGGMVSGPSHAEGGVPFTVQGRGGYEMEGGEFIVNKRATALHRDLLERINNSQRVKPMAGSYKFAQGGLVNARTEESVDYLKAIAEATTSTAIQASKPVRAFVSGKDLRSNETERRLRDRNDRI